jgi:hypothetical protein
MSTSSSSAPSSSSGGNLNITQKSKSSTGAIVGGVIGALLGLAILAGVVVFILRRRSRGHGQDGSGTTCDSSEAFTRPVARSGGLTSNIDSVPTAFSSEHPESSPLPRELAPPISAARSMDVVTSANNLPGTTADVNPTEQTHQVQNIRQDKARLQRAPVSQISSPNTYHDDPDDLRSNLQALREEVELLRRAQHSQQAQGLSDGEAPPYMAFSTNY